MKHFLTSFPRVLIRHFSGLNLLWNIVAIALTYLIVINAGDWYYFTHTRNKELLSFFRPAIFLGGILPLLLPLSLILTGHTIKKRFVTMTGWALGQAALAGSFISSVYKAFTGRGHPLLSLSETTSAASTNFNFGFWNNGIFWGWPSSHTTIAFAMALALIGLFPKSRAVAIFSLLYAFYVGIGVSLSIHWFSDFVAGAIIGTIIGINVSKNFFPGNTQTSRQS